MVIEDFNFDSPKTKEFTKILSNLKLSGKKTLLLTNGNLTSVYKSGRNISKVKILEADKASTYDIVNNQVLLLQQGGVELINKSFGMKEAVD
jgi:large subunit ribosomal protein L4